MTAITSPTAGARTRRPRREACYEVVVRGTVGLAVGASLLPVRTEPGQAQTVLRATLSSGELADLVAALDSRGLRVASIAALG